VSLLPPMAAASGDVAFLGDRTYWVLHILGLRLRALRVRNLEVGYVSEICQFVT
jgi:hypothetical protein